MAHTHIGNAGDFLKHTILATAATEVARRFGAVCYIDPYCGESLFRRPTVFRPPTGHPKLAAFRAAEPAIDEWYFGSPVVAVRALSGTRVSLLLSDRDSNAVRSTEAAFNPDFWSREIPSVAPPFAADVRTQVTEFDLRRLSLAVPPTANILLLDPTYSVGYHAALRETIRVCRDSEAAVLLLAWGTRAWRLGGIAECESVEHGWHPLPTTGRSTTCCWRASAKSGSKKLRPPRARDGSRIVRSRGNGFSGNTTEGKTVVRARQGQFGVRSILVRKATGITGGTKACQLSPRATTHLERHRMLDRDDRKEYMLSVHFPGK